VSISWSPTINTLQHHQHSSNSLNNNYKHQTANYPSTKLKHYFALDTNGQQHIRRTDYYQFTIQHASINFVRLFDLLAVHHLLHGEAKEDEPASEESSPFAP
jgi:hypothetical protein